MCVGRTLTLSRCLECLVRFVMVAISLCVFVCGFRLVHYDIKCVVFSCALSRVLMLTKQAWTALIEDARGTLSKPRFHGIAWNAWLVFCKVNQAAWPSLSATTAPQAAPQSMEQLVRQQFPEWTKEQVMAALYCDTHILPLFEKNELTPGMLMSDAGWFMAKPVSPHTCKHHAVGESIPAHKSPNQCSRG